MSYIKKLYIKLFIYLFIYDTFLLYNENMEINLTKIISDIITNGNYWKTLRTIRVISYLIILFSWVLQNFLTYRSCNCYELMNEDCRAVITTFQQNFILWIFIVPCIWIILEIVYNLIRLYTSDKYNSYINSKKDWFPVFIKKSQNFIILIFRFIYFAFAISCLLFVVADQVVPFFNLYCLISLIGLLPFLPWAYHLRENEKDTRYGCPWFVCYLFRLLTFSLFIISEVALVSQSSQSDSKASMSCPILQLLLRLL